LDERRWLSRFVVVCRDRVVVVAFAVGAGIGWLFFSLDLALFESVSLPI